MTQATDTEIKSVERVAVDVEGVLAAVHSQFCKIYNSRHDTAYSREDIDYWDWVMDEIDFNDFMAITDSAWQEKNCGASIETITNKRELADALDRLKEKYTVDIVTSRTGVDEAIQAWLATRNLEYDSFQTIPHTETKARLNYDIYIDDKPSLTTELAVDQRQYLVSQPWNEDARKHARTINVDSLVEATDHILSNTNN